MAAWLTARKREFLGSCEINAWETWSGEISWQDHRRFYDSRHRPDLVGIRPDGRRVAVEVELAPRSIARLRGILFMHVVWRFAGKTNGVYYVCGDEYALERVKKAANTGRSYTYDHIGLTLVLLDTIKAQAREMRAADPLAVGLRHAGAGS
jgi:hypothetical protein